MPAGPHRPITRALASVALAALAASACSGGGSSARSAAATTTTTAPATTTSTTTAPTTTVVTAPAPVTATAPPAVPEDPQSLTRLIAGTEATIHDDTAPAATVEEQARLQQAAYRVLAAHPEWVDQVIAALPAPYRDAARANTNAAAELRTLTKPRTALPAWRIVAPAPADELLADYHAAEREIGVSWAYLAAIHLVETRLGRIRGTSTAGAQGPMQFMPATWQQYGNGGDINSNHDAIFAAARLLRRNGAPGDMAKALWNYNHSDHYVNAVTAYATRMLADDHAFRGYYHWQVYYRMVDGDRLLPVGYGA